MKLSINEIKKILPHRHPFLLIDTIEELEEGKTAIGKKCVSYNEPFFAGHYPDEPVMPGVLIIEAMAQVGAVVLLSSDKYKGKQIYFGSIDKARFRKKVIPGDVLYLEVEIIKDKGKFCIGKGTALVDQEIVASAEIMVVLGT
ncbi:3-hydroxyacyl-ACP dehydratase FabZ [Anaerocolumna xylanovorans]|uniref:3-hydroxyacyl-[acyl-carrier-protein] dehydratase FabZ n=1 Tax=Anaerocolumna xylanovorans DSM 12503 TaxID=1121345 RepID=A0A1M7YI41_9FIRM|nr:3-hydroxyacyl-ACP dehydratase FabZ [Anaerocolumna xylanovorans]SHO52297.1 3-hydroxyacyl-[acyl-carrier-protein] dehydratase [Anaerocolumna xylanovorans DSM 12503]